MSLPYCLLFTHLVSFFQFFVFPHVDYQWSGSLCSAVAAIHSLASVFMFVHLLALQKSSSTPDALIFMVTPHIPILISITSYMQVILFLSIDLFSLIMFACGKRVLYILLGIKLPLLAVSILYSHIYVLYLPFVFSNLINSDLTQWKLKIFDFTMSNSFLPHQFPQHLGTCHELLCMFLCCHLLAPFCSGFCTLTQIIGSSTPSTALATGWTSVWLL